MNAEDSTNKLYVVKLHSNTCNVIEKTSDTKSFKFPMRISAFLRHYICNLSGQISNSDLSLKNKYSAIVIHCASCIESQL